MILSWLKRIEKRFVENDSQFCGCFDDFVNQMIEGIINGTHYETDDSELPKGFCEKCQKPCDVEMIESFTSRIDLILPAYADAPVSGSENAKEAVESELSGELSGLLPVSAAKLLGVSLNDINRYIRSGRLSLDASGKFVSFDSFDELQRLIQSKS